MAKKNVTQVEVKEPAEEMQLSPQQEEEKASPAQDKHPVACFFTADGVRVNSENQPIDEYGKVLDEKPLPRG
jgi:hypothetical protein